MVQDCRRMSLKKSFSNRNVFDFSTNINGENNCSGNLVVSWLMFAIFFRHFTSGRGVLKNVGSKAWSTKKFPQKLKNYQSNVIGAI